MINHIHKTVIWASFSINLNMIPEIMMYGIKSECLSDRSGKWTKIPKSCGLMEPPLEQMWVILWDIDRRTFRFLYACIQEHVFIHMIICTHDHILCSHNYMCVLICTCAHIYDHTCTKHSTYMHDCEHIAVHKDSYSYIHLSMRPFTQEGARREKNQDFLHIM